jgi:hypothetical protein
VDAPLPDFVARLLWDIDPARVDLERDAPLVLERVMSRGSWEAMKWLRARYSREKIAEFLRQHGERRLSPRDVAYWSAVCGLGAPAGVGGGRPSWAG